MPTDDGAARRVLDPVLGAGAAVADDAAVVDALVASEVALVRALSSLGIVPPDAGAAVSEAFGWVRESGTCRDHGIDAAALAAAAPASGSPVLPLVAAMRERAGEELAPHLHLGATSQDILDTALMSVAARAGAKVADSLDSAAARLADLAAAHRATPAVARTLTQHAGPTTVGLRAAGWVAGLRRAATRMRAAVDATPVQVAGSSGTLSSFVELARAAQDGDPRSAHAAEDVAAAVPRAVAAELGLAAPEAPWHTVRWPVTELGDALVQAVDACGAFAADVATLSRTEIGELSVGDGGRSTAMPHKRNPTAAVLIRGAAIRAPHLGASLHSAAALAADERPDGAWHAEWPVLQELLQLAAGASATAAELAGALTVHEARVAQNLELTGGLVASERLALVLGPVIGADRVAELVAAALDGGDLATLLTQEPGLDGLDVDALLDPAQATGLAARFVDEATRRPEGA